MIGMFKESSAKTYMFLLFLVLVTVNYLPSFIIVLLAVKIWGDQSIVAVMVAYFIAGAIASLVTCALLQALIKWSLKLDQSGETFYLAPTVANPILVGTEMYLMCRDAINRWRHPQRST